MHRFDMGSPMKVRNWRAFMGGLRAWIRVSAAAGAEGSDDVAAGD